MIKEKSILIDASGVRSLGGVIQVRSLLNSFGTEKKYMVTLVATVEVVDGCESVKLTENTRLKIIKKDMVSAIKKNKLFWSEFIDHSRYDVIFICNGIYFGPRKNICLILQNQLPFDFSEVLRYFPSIYFFKYLALFFLFCLSSAFAEYVVFVSKSSRQFISQNMLFKILSWRTEKVVNHISIDEIYPFDEVGELKSFPSDQSRFKGIYLASVECYRNHEALADAVSVFNRETDFKLSVVCAGPSNLFVRRKIERKNVEKNLIFMDVVSRTEIDSLSKNFDVGFYLSSCETFGLGLIDKVLRGIPTVVLRTPVSIELLGSTYPFFVEDLLPGNIAKVCRKVLFDRSKNTIFEFNHSQLRIKQFSDIWNRSQMEKYL